MTVFITVLLTMSVFVNAYANEVKPKLKDNEIVSFDTGEDTISVTIPIGTYEIKYVEQAHEISVENFGRLLIPGKPNLPSKIFSVAIPPGAEMIEVSFDATDAVILPGSYDICPAPLPRVIGNENPLIFNDNNTMKNITNTITNPGK